MNKIFNKLNVPFQVSPSTSFLKLFVKEISDNEESFVEFVAWMDDNSQKAVRFTFTRLLCGKLTSMSGEAGDSPYSIAFIENSDWLTQINNNQLKYYPEYPDNFKKMKHYIFKGHDCDVEVIAEDYSYAIL